MTDAKIFFIGANRFGKFGLGSNQSARYSELIECPNKSISQIFCGNIYNIFADDSFDNIFAAGANYQGQCALPHHISDCASYTEIRYFKEHEIKINKIFTNPFGNTTFFITNKNRLYICGQNIKQRLGSINQYTPKLIPNLNNVIDAKSATDNKAHYHIVLCSINDTSISLIISNLYRNHSVTLLPQDIINLLIKYTKTSIVYATTANPGTGHPKDIGIKKKYGWNRVNFFDDKHIVKIAVGARHTLFLDDNGVIWACGHQTHGHMRLGLPELELGCP